VQGRLTPGNYMVRGNISSQFISGLFFALPTLGANSYLTITDGLESASYLDMTVKALADFGVRIKKTDEHTFFIKGNQTYKNRELTVEGDYSNAAFFEALNVLGGNVAISGLRTKTWQGDAVCKEHLEALKRGKAQIDLTDCPDLGPVLMAVAAAHHGAVFTGTRRLKIKESDRGAAMAEELAKFGISTQVEENRIIVQSGILQKPRQPLDGHNDHRVVMSLAVLCTLTGGEIYGAQAVAKSFPDFFERLSSLGIQISLQ
ncbi:MAG: 3-phosphoshikimate 1-carboxyvinyltransferase, partial [Clostridia bacterium]|nr:3-phosphoshikimate 1-carboxyvinyltransferase [Clostridia bacterium]